MRALFHPLPALVAVLLLANGCGPGAANDPAADPDQGRAPTADALHFADSGSPPHPDTSLPPGTDSGAPSPVDAQATARDSASPPADSALPPADSGTPAPTYPQHEGSAYAQLAQDTTVQSTTTLLEQTITLPKHAMVLVASDGRVAPNEQEAAASLAVHVDGTRASSVTVIDWRRSAVQIGHSYSVVGVRYLTAGTHRVSLVATSIARSFHVGSGSNLIVFVQPASQVKAQTLGADSQAFDFYSGNITARDQYHLLPHTKLIEHELTVNGGDVIALAAGRAFEFGHAGDAMLGLYLDGAVDKMASSWTVNDLWSGAELQAPVYAHALFSNLAAGAHRISLDATEFPWSDGGQGEDPVIYKVGAETTLVTLNGGMHVRGRQRFEGSTATKWLHTPCIGSSTGHGTCPAVGTTVTVAKTTFDVPAGHPGIVYFSAKTRVQSGGDDPGGYVALRLQLDGAPVGSVGLQWLKYPNIVSQRTMTASYLTVGNKALAPGTHTLELTAKVVGEFNAVYLWGQDTPLVYFD